MYDILKNSWDKINVFLPLGVCCLLHTAYLFIQLFCNRIFLQK
jgi:hypothetical protein